MEWVFRDGLRWLAAELPGARAAFTTRLGGASGPPFESLNLGAGNGDSVDSVGENRRRAAAALGHLPAAVAIGRQVHGAAIQRHREPQACEGYSRPGEPLEPADGHVTGSAGLALAVLVADCLPVAMAGPGGVAMLHCGWRGLAAGILSEGAAAVGATNAAIGPGIGPCCYAVGADVLAAFAPLGEGVAEGEMLDLVEVARRLLAREGIEAIEAAGLCTRCLPELFYSHRRDGERSGRQGGFAWKT